MFNILSGKNGIKCPQAVKNLKGQYLSIEDLTQDGKYNIRSSNHICRVFDYK